MRLKNSIYIHEVCLRKSEGSAVSAISQMKPGFSVLEDGTLDINIVSVLEATEPFGLGHLKSCSLMPAPP